MQIKPTETFTAAPLPTPKIFFWPIQLIFLMIFYKCYFFKIVKHVFIEHVSIDHVEKCTNILWN